jgi:vancomycin resistance protein VanJ
LIETLAAYEPVVLGGDLNERPHRGAVAILSTRFVDAFERAGEGSGETFPATAPLHRIDYVLCSHDLGPVKAAVVPIVASDHLAVAVDFRDRSDSVTS